MRPDHVRRCVVVRAWRITRRAFAETSVRAFDGMGAARYGQRWNARGVRAAYGSATISLAALEYLGNVHEPYERPMDLVTVAADFDSAVVETPDPDLIHGWDTFPPNSSVAFGTRWIEEQRTVVLRVPSVMIPSESNFVLNPKHPDFVGAVRFEKVRPFAFDRRLFGRRNVMRRIGPVPRDSRARRAHDRRRSRSSLAVT
jgi:RES domain-containing protein